MKNSMNLTLTNARKYSDNFQVFTFHVDGKDYDIRVIVINGEAWFVGKDVAIALGYVNPSKAVMTHVDDEDKRFEMLRVSDSQNGNLVKTALINLSGVISLVLSSKLLSAHDFKRWVTSEVIPSVMKTGKYELAPQSREEQLASALVLATQVLAERDERIKRLSTENAAMLPKAEHYDRVMDTGNGFTATTVAKRYGWSAIKLNRTLHEWHIQYKVGNQWVLYAEYADKGYTVMRETESNGYAHSDTLWTAKGVEFIDNLMKEHRIEIPGISS